MGVVGLGACSVFEAAAADGVDIAYPGVVQGAPGSPSRAAFDAVVDLVKACLCDDPDQRPDLRSLNAALRDVLQRPPVRWGVFRWLDMMLITGWVVIALTVKVHRLW